MSYTISTDKDRLDVAMIHEYLGTTAYWSQGIPRETVERAIAHSLNFGVFANNEQAGYARVVSDQATFAYLCDVFILPAHQGQGLSKMLLEAVMTYPALQGLRRWCLLTRDAHGLYRQFGWQDIADPARWMEVHNKQVYKQ